MKRKIASLLIASVGLLSSTVNAQTVLDGTYVKENVPARKVIPYTFLREADVMWSRRVWRVIDLREKVNLPLYYPTTPLKGKRSLMQTMYDGVVKDGSITAYDGGDDEFKKVVTKAEILAQLNRVDTFQVENPETGTVEQKIVPAEFDPGKVVKVRVKEEWFFDKQKSVLECRILGLCPVMIDYASDGSIRGEKPIFWLYYPECRYVFANQEVYNRQNDAERRTLEDIIWKRQFGSFVYKVSNVFAAESDSRRIADTKTGLDALLEAEKVKQEIFEKEHDLWEF
jgi:gliding motility associated protien GldN